MFYFVVWTFLRECNLPYCCLYDEGYTSIGCINDTIRNPALLMKDSDDHNTDKPRFHPAYMLHNSELERDCRSVNI